MKREDARDWQQKGQHWKGEMKVNAERDFTGTKTKTPAEERRQEEGRSAPRSMANFNSGG